MSNFGVVPNASTSEGPAMACANNKLVFAWKDDQTDEIRWALADLRLAIFGSDRPGSWKELSTLQWSASNVEFNGGKTRFSPALASDLNSLAIAWTDVHTGRVKVSMFTGAGWSNAEEVPGSSTGSSPAIAFYCGNLHVTWRDARPDFAEYIWGSARLNGAFLENYPLSAMGPYSHHAPAMTSVDASGGPTVPVPPTDPNQQIDFILYPTWAVIVAYRVDQYQGVPEGNEGLFALTNLSFVNFLYTAEYPNPWQPTPSPVTPLAPPSGPFDVNFSPASYLVVVSPGTPAVAVDANLGLVAAWSDNGKIQFAGSSALPPFSNENEPVYSIVVPEGYSNGTFTSSNKPALAYATQLLKGSEQMRFLLCAWTTAKEIHFSYGPRVVDNAGGPGHPNDAAGSSKGGIAGQYPGGLGPGNSTG
jgi:hypothetical protein